MYFNTEVPVVKNKSSTIALNAIWKTIAKSLTFGGKYLHAIPAFPERSVMDANQADDVFVNVTERRWFHLGVPSTFGEVNLEISDIYWIAYSISKTVESANDRLKYC